MTTMMQKMGFRDEDMACDIHDDILQWADANSPRIADYIFDDIVAGSDSKIEVPVTNGNNIVGFADQIILPYPADVYPNILVEVKSYITNVGQLLRQLRVYQHYTQGMKFAVVCPTGDHRDFLTRQGIHYIYPKDLGG